MGRRDKTEEGRYKRHGELSRTMRRGFGVSPSIDSGQRSAGGERNHHEVVLEFNC